MFFNHVKWLILLKLRKKNYQMVNIHCLLNDKNKLFDEQVG